MSSNILNIFALALLCSILSLVECKKDKIIIGNFGGKKGGHSQIIPIPIPIPIPQPKMYHHQSVIPIYMSQQQPYHINVHGGHGGYGGYGGHGGYGGEGAFGGMGGSSSYGGGY